jgi:ubiquinone biosynthesis protein COQ9
MKSPMAAGERDRLIEAMLPDIAFDGWSRQTLYAAARRIGMEDAEALALFPRGAVDLAAGFSRWADHRMLDRLAAAPLGELATTARIRLALLMRFQLLMPHREAVRRALGVLALPPHAALGIRLVAETVDGIWYAAGDDATDFSFYTKRATLAALYAAAVAYWLDDRSPEGVDTAAFIDRRLDDLKRVMAARHRLDAAFERLPNPFRFLRPAR